MSLLLDALKKSGDDRQQGGLTLEDAAPARTPSASAPQVSAPARAAGENLFAAKKKKTSPGWKLGLVPTTLLIALIFGSGYGYYVWLQISPPSQPVVAQRTAPPPTPVAAAHTAPAIPLVPLMPPQERPSVASQQQAPISARNEEFDAPRAKPSVAPARERKTFSPAVSVQRKVTVDTITSTLLNAYQAYQRGDYVTASQSYREVLGQDEHNRDALLGMAAIAQQEGQEETAQGYYRQLLVLDPRDPAAQSALMTYGPETGNTESRLKLLLAEHPRSGALHFALGNHYASQSGWGEAQQYYFNAHTLEPANAQFAFNLAVSLDHLGQRKLAAQYYQQALQLDVYGHSGFDHTQAQQRLNELTAAR